VQSPLQASSVSQTETSKERKGKHISQDKEVPKEFEEEERESHHSPKRELSSHLAPELEEVPSAKTTTKKGRKLHFPSPTVVVHTRARRPFTRSSAHKEDDEEESITKAHVQKKYKGKGENVEKPMEIIDITTPHDKSTFNRIIRQLRYARKEIVHLKGERLTKRKNMSKLMDMYNETLDLARFTTRRFVPLHRKIQTLYRKNKSL